MAITKIKPIKSILKKALDDICNPIKTDDKILVSSFGCSIETADIEFGFTLAQSLDSVKPSFLKNGIKKQGIVLSTIPCFMVHIRFCTFSRLPGCHENIDFTGFFNVFLCQPIYGLLFFRLNISQTIFRHFRNNKGLK